MLISFRQATEMFQFTHFPPSCLCVQQAVSRYHSGGVAPFGISGFFACMQLPLNVSPVSASFIGQERQGIHLVRCVACSYLLCSSASLSLFGKIEVRKDLVVNVQLSVPRQLESGKQPWLFSLKAGLYRPGSR